MIVVCWAGVQSPPQTPGASTATPAAVADEASSSAAEAVERAAERLVAALRTARRVRPQATPPPPNDAAVQQILLQWLGHKVSSKTFAIFAMALGLSGSAYVQPTTALSVWSEIELQRNWEDFFPLIY